MDKKISINQWLQLSCLDKAHEMKQYVNQIDINSVDSEGNSALNMACRHNSIKVAKWLISQSKLYPNNENDIGMLPIFQAVMGDNIEITQMLIKNFPNLINSQNSKGLTNLHIAIANQSDKTFNYLLSVGNLDINLRDKKGETALQFCAIHNHISSAKMLLKKGANPNISKTDFSTPLMSASKGGFNELVKLLLEYAPELINYKNLQGNTALHLAAQSLTQNTQTIEMLLNHGADYKNYNHSHETPKDCAQKIGNIKLVGIFNNWEEKEKFEVLLPQTQLNKKTSKL